MGKMGVGALKAKIGLKILDFVLDFINIAQFYYNRETTFGTILLLFQLVHTTVSTIYSLPKAKNYPLLWSSPLRKARTIGEHLLGLASISLYRTQIDARENSTFYTDEKVFDLAKHVAYVTYIETFLETIPQLQVIIYVAYYHCTDGSNVIQFLKIMISLNSICLTMVSAAIKGFRGFQEAVEDSLPKKIMVGGLGYLYFLSALVGPLFTIAFAATTFCQRFCDTHHGRSTLHGSTRHHLVILSLVLMIARCIIPNFNQKLNENKRVYFLLWFFIFASGFVFWGIAKRADDIHYITDDATNLTFNGANGKMCLDDTKYRLGRSINPDFWSTPDCDRKTLSNKNNNNQKTRKCGPECCGSNPTQCYAVIDSAILKPAEPKRWECSCHKNMKNQTKTFMVTLKNRLKSCACKCLNKPTTSTKGPTKAPPGSPACQGFGFFGCQVPGLTTKELIKNTLKLEIGSLVINEILIIVFLILWHTSIVPSFGDKSEDDHEEGTELEEPQDIYVNS